MEKQRRKARSHLFTVRVWEEELGPDTTEWRGKVQLLTSGEVCYFRAWRALVPLLQAMLAQVESAEPGRRETDSSGEA